MFPRKDKECGYTVDESSMISYTEDGVPIEKIYVANLPPEVTVKQVTEYFEQFGHVAHVTIKQGVPRQEPYFYGFVTFKEPHSATKALRFGTLHKYIYFHGVDMQIKPADSWLQPKKDQPRKNFNSNGGSIANENLKLEIREKILCHKRLDATLTLLDLTLMEILEILSEIGSHIEILVCTGRMSEQSKGRIFQLLLQNCANVKTLVCVDPSSCWFNELQTPFKDQLDLDFDMSSLLFLKPTYDHYTDLHNFRNLQYLDLSNNRDVTGMYLVKLCNLKVLNLRNCRKLEPKYFKAICMQNELVTLYIERCKRLDSESIETLASTQTKLENLSISCHYEATPVSSDTQLVYRSMTPTHDYETTILSPLTTMNSLKRLRIDCRRKICDSFFQELAERRCKELEILAVWNCCFNEKVEQAICSLKNLRMLEICGWSDVNDLFLTKLAAAPSLECLFISYSDSVPEEGILNLIRNSQTLKEVCVVNCFGLSPQLACNAFEILKKNERKQPLNLIANDACIIDGELVMKQEKSSIKERLEKMRENFNCPWDNSDYNCFIL